MLTKSTIEIGIADIQALLGVAESRYLDFKSGAVGGAERDKREFLADVSAFANASGGDVLFGVDERDGVASAVPGITLVDPDQEKRRLGDLIRSGLEPRLAHFEIEWLPMEANQGVLVVRVPRSWNAPHRVTLQGHDKFYVRNSAGKHPMNTDELRRAFTFGQSLEERIRRFREGRVSLLMSDEGPFPIQAGGSKLLFHLVPLVAFADPPNLPLGPQDTTHLQPFGASGWDHRYTLEGFATHAGPRDGSGLVRAYTLAFRTGIIEAAGLLEHQGQPINLARVERYVVETWTRTAPLLKRHGIEPPLYVLASLINVRGLTAVVPQELEHEIEPSAYRRDNLILPPIDVSAETVGRHPTSLMRPLFDMLANAFGLSQSFNYGSDGRYRPLR